MKILLVNYEYKPQGGGAGLGTYNMAKAFQQMGHEVSLLVGWDYKFGQPEILNDIETHIIRMKKKNIHQSTALGLLKFVIEGLFKINQITRNKQFDIIQFYFSVPTGILKYGLHKKVPYVVSLRGMDIPGLHNDKYNMLSILTQRINYEVVKSAAAVTSLSIAAGKYFEEFAPDIKLDIIPNAVEYEMYQIKDSYSVQISKFVAVSRLTEVKKLDLMIKAFAKIHEKYPSVILDIYGEGREKDNLKKLIDTCHAGNYIRLKGYASREKLVCVLPEYDVFSLMSVGDSFGIAFIEAMSAGLPVICAKAGGPEEIVIDGETGILAIPDSLDDTVRVIKYCIENPNIMENMGRKARKRVEEYYSISGVAKQHIALYERCLRK